VSSFSQQVINEEQAEFSEDVEDSAEVTADDPVGDDFEFDGELILDNGDASEQECETAPTSQQFMEEDLAEDFAIESVEEAAELAETSIAEEADEEQLRARTEHDVVQPVEDRPLQPSRLVDAVLPLLAELDEDLDSIVPPGMAGRSVLDIEAELIETTDQNSNELEDLIGKTMLDICLDTQSALQDSAAAIRNAEVADLKNFSDFDDTSDELPAEPFDIVQPEPPRRDEGSSYRLEARFEDTPERTKSDGAMPASPSPDKQAEKPFGRLFSGLRRRKS
jgi:hypothetical protein